MSNPSTTPFYVALLGIIAVGLLLNFWKSGGGR
jgi:hypothetical protein